MRRIISFIVAAVALLGFAGMAAASASAETVTSDVKVTPKGSLYKEAFKPINLSLSATVTPDAGQTKLRELNNVKFNLPPDFTFNTEGSEVCTKDIGQINPENANKPTAAVIAECPNSVVGSGTATILLAGQTSLPVSDPVLTAFNGGTNDQGEPQIFIQGYSATVVAGGHGIPMNATLHKDGSLDVGVPPLAANSAVSTFTLELPGTQGKDQSYSQAKCPGTGWDVSAVLTLGAYNPNTGQYDNVQDLTSASQNVPCTGAAGKGAFSTPKVKGPKSVKKGKKGTFKVTVKNSGTATASGVKVAASGKGAKGSGSTGKIAPGASKTITVKVKFTKSGTSKVKFKATAKGVAAKTGTFKVKVK